VDAPQAPWRDEWHAQADAWIELTHNDPMYEYINRPSFLQLLPPPGELTLDIGCGEGRMARELLAVGHNVLGVDGSPSLARAVATHATSMGVAVGDIHHLPVRDEVADLVVCFMVLMDVDDLDVALRELARVLRAGGQLCLAVLHPIASAGLFLNGDEYHTFYMGEYLKPMRHVIDIDRHAGGSFRFRIAHRPIEHYSRALEDAGFVIEAIREPQPDADAVARFPHLSDWARVPDFLQLRAAKTTRP
jgi:SAM-dependent methyltransferase